MPLNKTEGEPIPSLGPHYVVPVQDFSREPAFKEAMAWAKSKFKDAGARHEIDFGPDDVLAQVHPETKPRPTLVFWFRHRTRGGIVNREEMDDERFVHYAFQIATVQHKPGSA